MKSWKVGLRAFWGSKPAMSWFDLLAWFSSRGIPEKEVARRYLAIAAIGLLMIGALSCSWWVFAHWNIIVAVILCIASWVIAFIVALWAVGRILPAKIHTSR